MSVDWDNPGNNLDGQNIAYKVIIKENIMKIKSILGTKNNPEGIVRLEADKCPDDLPIPSGTDKYNYTCYQIYYIYDNKEYNCDIEFIYDELTCERGEDRCLLPTPALTITPTLTIYLTSTPVNTPTPTATNTPTPTATNTPTPTPTIPIDCPTWAKISQIRVLCPDCACYNKPECTPQDCLIYGNDFRCYEDQCVRIGAEFFCLTPTP